LKDGIIFLLSILSGFIIWFSFGKKQVISDYVFIFRALNRASVKDHFPLPNMEMILQQVVGSQMMSLLDGFSGYYQIKVKMTDKYKTTFITRWGTFAYERMTFGLSNACATFQIAMQITFDDLIDKIIQIYLDELTVYISKPIRSSRSS
jgi:hypothetical protein